MVNFKMYKYNNQQSKQLEYLYHNYKHNKHKILISIEMYKEQQILMLFLMVIQMFNILTNKDKLM